MQHRDIDEVIEDIQMAFVECGGRFVRRSEIKEMTVEELLKTLLPNDVEFNIKHRPVTERERT